MTYAQAVDILFALAFAKRQRAEALRNFDADTATSSHAIRAALLDEQAAALDLAVATLQEMEPA